MIIYKDISLELLNWLVEEIESKKYNRVKLSIILKMAIKYNSIGTNKYITNYYDYNERDNILTLMKQNYINLGHSNSFEREKIKKIILK